MTTPSDTSYINTGKMLFGSFIGEGAFRKVYSHALDKSLVIKVESHGRDFANIIEWEVWSNLQYTPFKKFLAPCHYISPEGSILLQSKTTPLDSSKRIPKNIPAFMTDVKSSNWGFLNGKVVCHDYGTILFSQTTKLKKAKPW